MCGIYGLILKPGSQIRLPLVHSTLMDLAKESQSRGKDSSGFSLRSSVNREITVVKGDIAASHLIDNVTFKDLIRQGIANYQKGSGFCGFGHARLVTNGTQLNAVNNQPVIKDDFVIIHNGIIVNHNKIWEKCPDLKRDFTIDTEIIPALVRSHLRHDFSVTTAIKKATSELEGTFSIAGLAADMEQFVFASNNGSLYFLTDSNSFFLFASEESHLKKQLKKSKWGRLHQSLEIHQLSPGNGMILDLKKFSLQSFSLSENSDNTYKVQPVSPYEIKVVSIENPIHRREVIIDPSKYINKNEERHLFELLEKNDDNIFRLKRCTKCILPETFPFISFDHTGTCNYCSNYVIKDRKSREKYFLDLLSSKKRNDGQPDCIVPFSGGRDSTYTMHYLVNEVGMRPLAYTYDWGMVTDLARRNIARVCGKHGIEHIIVAADIWKKRGYIKKNVLAWLKKPELGMIPLFMSGDKAFHLHLRRLQIRTGIDLNVWGENYLEKTDFKTGFAGVRPEFNKKNLYSLSSTNSFILLKYLLHSTVTNPSYLNESVIDNLFSQFSRSFQKKVEYYNFFDYHVWDENKVVDTIVNEYDWEFAVDTDSSWRIGDGTSAFYNYIYYTVAGFSENDTFRSNQIREGMITRDQALILVAKENQPRYETLRWYLDIIGLDFAQVIKLVNKIPKLYTVAEY